MTNWIRLGIAVLVMSVSQSAWAQYNGYLPNAQANPFGRPTVSPYLNLLRQPNNPVLDYYGIVRPNQQLQREIDLNRQNAEPRYLAPGDGLIRNPQAFQSLARGGAPLPRTGHSTQFRSNLGGNDIIVNQTLKARRAAVFDRAQRSASLLPNSGHHAFFGNHYQYYAKPLQPVYDANNPQ
ncbi:hypothetical protein [Thalassoroseus pseudoceratinae]|uniref:hypothetical protein n=1 Tax=Thalassoroseus pseudoceratinae TaxID=2713176 RepID=UPI00142353AA|nr:hypothetical protein [Thalassoroseus pseudoceratinae]